MTPRRSRLHRLLWAGACLLGALAPWSAAQAQSDACSSFKGYVLTQLAIIDKQPPAEREALEANLYQQAIALGCDKDGSGTAAFYNAARQCGAAVSHKGSTAWEEMSCCGYDPQRRTFACPVRINRNTGFGGSPLPGSREFVMNCVFDAQQNGWREVGTDSVHLSDSVFAPPWQFAVVANAHRGLDLVQPMDGSTKRARSILSWSFRPTGCDFKPVWGNVIDYRIRLDQ